MSLENSCGKNEIRQKTEQFLNLLKKGKQKINCKQILAKMLKKLKKRKTSENCDFSLSRNQDNGETKNPRYLPENLENVFDRNI